MGISGLRQFLIFCVLLGRGRVEKEVAQFNKYSFDTMRLHANCVVEIDMGIFNLFQNILTHTRSRGVRTHALAHALAHAILTQIADKSRLE